MSLNEFKKLKLSTEASFAFEFDEIKQQLDWSDFEKIKKN